MLILLTSLEADSCIHALLHTTMHYRVAQGIFRNEFAILHMARGFATSVLAPHAQLKLQSIALMIIAKILSKANILPK
jgi:hypothetical protein